MATLSNILTAPLSGGLSSSLNGSDGGGGGGGSLYGLIMADGPVNYWRNGEPNTTGGMVDEVAAAGGYAGAVSTGNPALYPGAGAGTSIGGFSSSKVGFSAEFPSSLASMTLVTVVEFSGVSGLQTLGTNRDQNGSGRKYQWRTNGTAIEFVRITGGVGVYTVTGVLATATPYIIACEVDSSGNVTIYINGVAQSGSWTVGSAAAADFGGAGDLYQIGYSDGISQVLNGYTCENAVFDYVVGATRQADYATAAGL